jgi:hypothetical protein
MDESELAVLRKRRFDFWLELWDPKEKELSGLAKVLWGVWIGGSLVAGWFGGQVGVTRAGVTLALICWLIYFLIKRSMTKEVEAEVEARYPRKTL